MAYRRRTYRKRRRSYRRSYKRRSFRRSYRSRGGGRGISAGRLAAIMAKAKALTTINKDRYEAYNKYLAPSARAQLYSQNAVGSAQSKAYFGETFQAAKDAYRDGKPDQLMRRKAARYYGAGDYRQWLKDNVPAGTFASAGRWLGGRTGVPGLDEVGSWAGGKVASYLGWGDYAQTNQLIDGTGPDSQSQIQVNPMNNTGDVYLSHSEFVQNITATAAAPGSSAFDIVKFQLNPGLSSTFPFLSQIAQNFELYDFQGLVFQFRPTSTNSSNTSNIGLGKVIMATRYDPDAADFINSVEMENYDYANSVKPTCGIHHGVETAQSQQAVNMMYVRTGESQKSKIFTDLGAFYVATEGIPFSDAGTAIIGELWVSYRIKLSRAKLYSSQLGMNCLHTLARAYGNPGSGLVLPVTYGAANTMNCELTSSFAGGETTYTVTFPPNINLGYYKVELFIDNENPADPLDIYGTGIPAYSLCIPKTPPTPVVAVAAPNSNQSGTQNWGAMIQTCVQVNAPGNSQAFVQLKFAGDTTGSMIITLEVTQVSQDYFNTVITL